MWGGSTRHYADVLPAMAESCGVSKSSVSREFAAASAQQLQALAERRFNAVDLLIICLDEVQIGAHHVLVAVGSIPLAGSTSWAWPQGRPRRPWWPSGCWRAG